MKNIVILISGRGSNMEAIVQACAREGWPARIAAVISNRRDAAGLDYARAQGLAAIAVDHKAYASREEFDAALMQAIDAQRPRPRRDGRLHAHRHAGLHHALRGSAAEHPPFAAARLCRPAHA